MKAYIVEKDRLKNNIELVRQAAGGRVIYGVLKGNGYGLGLTQLARELRDCGVERFAVNEPGDALKLRMAGFIDEEILILNSITDENEILDLMEAKATASVGSYDAAVKLNGIAEARGEIVEVHIKIDTGMSRYGFLPGETEKILSLYRFLPRLVVTGLYTHCNTAFLPDKTAEAQRDALVGVANAIREAGFDPGCVHIANSSYLFGHDMAGTDAVRIGSAFLGRLPIRSRNKHGLQPVGHAEASVGEVRWLEAGSAVGYGKAHVCRKATRIAIIPFGYSDGFGIGRENDLFRFRDKLRYLVHDFKALFSRKRLYVSISGKKAQVLGHIGMVHTIVDVTKIPCEIGDIARFELSPLYANPLLERRYE